MSTAKAEPEIPKSKDFRAFLLSLDPPDLNDPLDPSPPDSLHLVLVARHLSRARAGHRVYLERMAKLRVSVQAAAQVRAGISISKPADDAKREDDETKAAVEEERERERRRLVKFERVRPKTVAEMTGREISQQIDAIFEGGRAERGLDRGRDEDPEDWVKRLETMDRELGDLATADFQRKSGHKMVYFEGLPLNLSFAKPNIMQLVLQRAAGVPTGEAPCLQCRAKGLRCSQALQHSTGQRDRSPCERCVRAGERCLAKWEAHPEMDAAWTFVDREERPSRVEEEERLTLVRELMGRVTEREGQGRFALVRWHENEGMLREAEKGGWGEEELKSRMKMWWDILGFKYQEDQGN